MVHLRQRVDRRVYERVKSLYSVAEFLIAVLQSYRLSELLPLMPLLFCLGLLSLLPDWMLVKADVTSEWILSLLLGGKRAQLRDAEGRSTGQSSLYSVVGALDPEFCLPDERLLCVPRSAAEAERSFPSRHAAGWGNATFLALCMKLAYEDWAVVRDKVNHEWRMTPGNAASTVGNSERAFLRPRFIKGCSFHFMKPAGVESTDELSHIHLDSDACLLALEDPTRAASTAHSAEEGAAGAGVALVLAFRGTEPLELADFQSDFDAVPESGEWGCLHPGFLLALGLDPNLNPYHQTLTTFTRLKGDEQSSVLVEAEQTTPYEVLRNEIVQYMNDNPSARLYITGHSLGGALAVVFTGALMHDTGVKAMSCKSRVGALYTFGQPRVGDYEFLCHLQVSLLEPHGGAITNAASSAGPSKSANVPAKAAANGNSSSDTCTAADTAPAPAASKLKGLLAGKGHDEPVGPPLTSRYIRVVNTYDIVPHIPPTLCNLYQHGGDLMYLQIMPGHVKFLTEQPLFTIGGIWTSSMYKLFHYTVVGLGIMDTWKGCDNWIRWSMRVGAVALPFLIAGLNDHMPGDYCQHIINSTPAAWQPFKSRKKLSRWTNALMFARALQSSSMKCDTSASVATDANVSGSGDSYGNRSHKSRSARLQARLMQQGEQSSGRDKVGFSAVRAAAHDAKGNVKAGDMKSAASDVKRGFKAAVGDLQN